MSGERAFSVEELAARAGVSVRTVRYYITEGLLPGPATRGKYASYDEDHLARLQLIRRLVDQHVPLAELRERLARLSAAEVQVLLRQEERTSRMLEQARGGPSPRDYVSGLLANARGAPTASPAPGAATHYAARAQPGPRLRSLVPAVPSNPVQPEPVQRWELAPGVELYVRADAARQHAHLIERLLESARDELGRDSS